MNIVQIFSPKGGVGVTSVVAALASSFARLDVSVTALDLSGQDSLKLHFGVQPDHALPSALDLSAPIEAVGGVQLLAGPEPEYGQVDARTLCARALESSDIVFVDWGSFSAAAVEALAADTLATIAVLGADAASVGVLPRLTRLALPHLSLLINHLDPRLRLSQDAANLMKQTFGERVLGTIRRDQAVPEALAMGETLAGYAPRSGAAADVEAVTQALLTRLASDARAAATHADAA